MSAEDFHHGYLAGKEGQAGHTNPHARHTREYDNWRTGWLAGCKAGSFGEYPRELHAAIAKGDAP